jgi:hypothetical protein
VKLLIKIAANSLILAYVIFSLITLSDCTDRNNASTGDRLASLKRNSALLLLQKFDAIMFDAGSGEIPGRPVVLDTLMLGVIRKGGSDFVRAEIRCGGDKKYYAELRCSSEILNSYRITKSNSALLAAKISRIDDCPVIAEADSLDGKTTRYNLGKSILLSGECLAIAEIPSVLNAD